MIKKLILLLLSFFDFFHQRKIIKFLSKNNLNKLDILFDVGAHKGESIDLFLSNMDIKKIISFEPSPINFLQLKNDFFQIYKTKMPFRKTFEYIYVKKN